MFSHFLRKLRALGRPGALPLEAGGFFWQVEPAGKELFGPAGPDLPAWTAAGWPVVVKTNLQRTISRVPLPNGTVYVKSCRVNTPRSWAREILRPAKARLEFENALTLARLKVHAVEPLAWGARSTTWPGESVLITREQGRAIPFMDFLETNLPALLPEQNRRTRQQIAREFGAFLAHLHDAGVAHPDPHLGNFLIELDSSGPERFILTDLHAIRFGKPLDWAATKENLTLMNRWVQVRASAADRARFWQAYRAARKTLTLDDPAAKELERETVASNNRFWTNRLGRYVGNNRDSHRVRGPAARGYAARELPKELVAAWLRDPDGVFDSPSVRVLKDSRSSTVAEVVVEMTSGPRVVIYKRFRVKSWWKLFKNVLRQSQALRSWVVGNNVRDRSLPTARPLAVFERRRWGIPRTGYVVFEKIPDAIELDRAVANLNSLPSSQQRRILQAWAERLGRLLRTMHDREVSDRDLKAPNLLVSGSDPMTARPVLIDLVGVEVGRTVPQRVRVRDLARLNASFRGSTLVRRGDRLRLLQTYLGPAKCGDWKSWWNAVAAATERKVARNRRTGRPLG